MNFFCLLYVKLNWESWHSFIPLLCFYFFRLFSIFKMDHLIGNSDLSGAITKSLKHPDHVQYYDMVLQIQKPQLYTTETGVMHIYDVSDDTISFPGLVLGKNAIAQYEQTTKKTLKLEALDLINVNIKVVVSLF